MLSAGCPRRNRRRHLIPKLKTLSLTGRASTYSVLSELGQSLTLLAHTRMRPWSQKLSQVRFVFLGGSGMLECTDAPVPNLVPDETRLVTEFLKVEYSELTDVGVKRSHNQDAMRVQLAPDAPHWERIGHIFVVADGMGGHAVGEKASAQAAREIPHTYSKYASDGPSRALRRAFLEANAGIHAIGQENPEFKGLGTTATALVLRPEGAWVGHVGDSRAYRIRHNRIEQLTFDHSLVWALAAKEGIPPEQLTDIRRNVIIRSLGPDALVEVDIEGPHPLQTGDVFLLCSDGLSNQLTDEELGVIAGSLPPADAARLLVELANLRGGPDNITAVVVQVGEVTPPKVPPPEPLLRRWAKGWGDRIPWPLTVLLGGFVLAVTFIIWSSNGWPGSSVFFGAAALAIGIGLVGLGMHALRAPTPEGETDIPRPLTVYRRADCQLTRSMLDRVVEQADQLWETVQERGWTADLALVEQARTLSRQQLEAGELLSAFLEQCRALQTLAHGFNLNRHKEEAFQPKWDMASTE